MGAFGRPKPHCYLKMTSPGSEHWALQGRCLGRDSELTEGRESILWLLMSIVVFHQIVVLPTIVCSQLLTVKSQNSPQIRGLTHSWSYVYVVACEEAVSAVISSGKLGSEHREYWAGVPSKVGDQGVREERKAVQGNQALRSTSFGSYSPSLASSTRAGKVFSQYHQAPWELRSS